MSHRITQFPQELRNFVMVSRPYLLATYRDPCRPPVPASARLPFEGCLQEVSGRCWIFAYVNELQLSLMERHNRVYELSRDWVYFHHLLAQSRALLEAPEGPLVRPYLGIQQDSFYGQFSALIESYGIVPYQVFPNHPVARNAHRLISTLNALVATLRIRLREANEPLSLEEAIETVRRFLHSHFEVSERFHFEGVEYTPLTFADFLGIRGLYNEYVTIQGFSAAPRGALTLHPSNMASSHALALRTPFIASYNLPEEFQEVYNALMESNESFIIGQASFVNRSIDRYYGECIVKGLEDLLDPSGRPTQAYLARVQEAIGMGIVSLAHKICRWSSPEETGTGYLTVIDSSEKHLNCMWVTQEGLFADTYEVTVRRSILQRVCPEVSALLSTFSQVHMMPSALQSAYGYN